MKQYVTVKRYCEHINEDVDITLTYPSMQTVGNILVGSAGSPTEVRCSNICMKMGRDNCACKEFI